MSSEDGRKSRWPTTINVNAFRKENHSNSIAFLEHKFRLFLIMIKARTFTLSAEIILFRFPPNQIRIDLSMSSCEERTAKLLHMIPLL